MAAAQTMAMTTTQKIIAIAVTIIIISTVAIPIIDDMEKQFEVTSNNTTQRYTASTSLTDVDISISVANSIATINGYEVGTGNFAVIAISDTFVIRGQGSSSVAIAVDGTQYSASAATISGKVLSFTASGTDYTFEYDDYIYYAAENGKYGYFANTGTEFYVNSGSNVVYAFTNFVGTNNDLDPTTAGFYGVFSLSVENETLVPVWMESRTEGVEYISTSVVLPDGMIKDNEDGSYTITAGSVPIDFVTDLGTYSLDADHRIGFIAPIEYRHVVDSAGMIDLINIIPILLILIPVMMAVRMITLKRN
jgi:hypothetical protein